MAGHKIVCYHNDDNVGSNIKLKYMCYKMSNIKLESYIVVSLSLRLIAC